MEDAEAIRIARTESLFREVNERIAESSARFGADDASFVCECADPACAERVHARLGDYEEVRDDGAQFLLVEGHEWDDVEKVVGRNRRYNVVRKVKPNVRRLVERMNPRAASAQ
jgi:hypothetical protein